MRNILCILVVLFLFNSCNNDNEESLFEEYNSSGVEFAAIDVLQNIPILDTANFFNSNRLLESNRGYKYASSFSMDVPEIINQGGEGTCVAFSFGYTTRSYLLKRDYKIDFYSDGNINNKKVCSPEYLYNSARQPGSCVQAGMVIPKALEFVKMNGISTWESMPYSDDNGCDIQPNNQQKENGSYFKIDNYYRLENLNESYIKQILSNNHPIIIGVPIFQNFYDNLGEVIESNLGEEIGGHALVIIGWDDNLQAFKMANSWGKNWGDRGYGWVHYDHIGAFVRTITSSIGNKFIEAYVVETSYNEEIIPEVINKGIESGSETSVSLIGEVKKHGPHIVEEMGFCYSTNNNPTIEDNKVSLEGGEGDFIINIDNLSKGIDYYIRVYAKNCFGVGYGDELMFNGEEYIEGIPELLTNEITSITSSSSKSGGMIVEDQGLSVLNKGVCWSKNPNPTISDNKTNDGSGSSAFTSSLTDLDPNTTYYVRAYATNINGTGYGNELIFITQIDIPELSTSSVLDIEEDKVACGGENIFDGGSEILSKGLCWSVHSNPTIQDNFELCGEGDSDFVCDILNLNSNTTYYIRAFATNEEGTGYGNELSFKTLTGTPTIETLQIVSLEAFDVRLEGNIINDGGFLITERGVCWGKFPNPTLSGNKVINGNGIGLFSIEISNLDPNSLYYARAYAINSQGVFFGDEISFTTKKSIPIVETKPIEGIAPKSAISGGVVVNDGGADILSRGICWSQTPNPTVSDNNAPNSFGTNNYISVLSGLVPSTTYYARAFATNSEGVGYGEQLMFQTVSSQIVSNPYLNPNLTYGEVSDIDGNVYPTIQIGSYIWMAENLKTTRYNDGSEILYIHLLDYDNDSINGIIYGKLYSQSAVNSGKLCPTGWRIPTTEEWDYLSRNFDGFKSTGIADSGTGLWNSPNIGGTNETGFTGLPGGLHGTIFYNIGDQGSWWSSTQTSSSSTKNDRFSLSKNLEYFIKSSGGNIFHEASCRCIKDNG